MLRQFDLPPDAKEKGWYTPIETRYLVVWKVLDGICWTKEYAERLLRVYLLSRRDGDT